MKTFLNLSIAKQIFLVSKFVIINPDSTFVDSYDRPYELISGCKVVCTLRSFTSSYNSKN